jgi:predicted esterase
MTPERWREIERLYHSAREHGPGVLAETDPELRREVERLLAADGSGFILDRPVDELVDTTPPDPGWVGRTVSHYRILESLGAGGMGVVYKALDTRLGRLVALKFLPPHLRHDRELKQRLKEEARAASALDHPNIVVVHDIDETPEGDLFIAMALHEGTTLRERIRAGLSLAEALQIARQIASGLARAHENAIFHRDIKPANIVVANDGVARIIDFGLAKTGDATATAGGAKGTPLYMSPEQASGEAVDFRTDLWSLGALLYEMLTGKPPFRGDTQLQVMHAIVHDPAPRLRDARPDLPAEIDAIVTRALEKDPARRYQSAADMVRDLSGALTALEAPAQRRSQLRTAYSIAAALILLAGGAMFWLYRRSEQRTWAHQQAPRIAELAGKQPVSAFRLWKQAEEILPGDPQLAKLAQSLTVPGAVESTPNGAKVEIQDYDSPGGAWLSLGTTPVKDAVHPKGHFRWRLTLPGAEPFVAAPDAGANVHFQLPEPSEPAGMVFVPGGGMAEYIDFVGWVAERLPAFDIDKFEVTNAQYQQFVDREGYRKPQYWKEKFIKDGKTLSFDAAMELLRDSTGRPGPATWAGGHFPPGGGDYPVSGVSWYEAAAYAEFAGKSLPVLAQWFEAAPADLAADTIRQSNFGGQGAMKAGSTAGVGPYGTYDMAGNLREWCLNEIEDRRFILGGAWRTQTYAAYDPEAQSPFDRSELNGIRCVRNRGPMPEHAAAPVVRHLRDFSQAKPVSDEVFKAYQLMYAYDPAPAAPQNQTVVADTPDWKKERLTIDAGYGNQRLPVFVFIPKNVHPPFQAVVFYPSARVNDLPSSDALGDMQFIDYVIQSGRALIYPIYTGTYERRGDRGAPGAVGDLERIVKNAKEVRRSVDYLQSRPDIDKSKIAYLGVSQGTAEGVIYATLEDRFKAVVFLDGGFFLNPGVLPARDQVNFVTRLKKPVLMVNGRYDFSFSPERSQKPMFQMLGTPEADKRYVTFETPHDVSQKKAELSQEVLTWLDKYLGRPE